MRKELPVIACSLDGEGLQQRADEFRRLFARALEPGSPVDGGRAWRFPFALEADVRDLVTREQECCPFWDIDVSSDDDALRLVIRGPADAAPLLDRLAGVA